MSNEINTVASVRAKCGSEFYPEWNQNYCLPKNEVNTNYFVVSGNYGDTECPKLDDISKRNVTTYKYFISVSPNSVAWEYNNGLKQITVNVNSRVETYLNNVYQSTEYVGFNTSMPSDGLFKIVTQTSNSITLSCFDWLNPDGETYITQLTVTNARNADTRAIITMTWNP